MCTRSFTAMGGWGRVASRLTAGTRESEMEGGERRMCVVCDSSVCPLCQVPPDYVPYRLFALFVRFPQTMFLIVCLPSLSGSPRLCSLSSVCPLCQVPPDYVPYRLFALLVRFPQTMFLIVCLPSLSDSPRLSCSLSSVCPLCQVPPDPVPYRLFALFVRFPQTMFLRPWRSEARLFAPFALSHLSCSCAKHGALCECHTDHHAECQMFSSVGHSSRRICQWHVYGREGPWQRLH